MKKIFLLIFYIFLISVSHAGSPYYFQPVISPATGKVTVYMAGNLYLWSTLNSSTWSFTLEGGTITRCGGLYNVPLITATNFTVTTSTITTLFNESFYGKTFYTNGADYFTFIDTHSATRMQVGRLSATRSGLDLMNGSLYIGGILRYTSDGKMRATAGTTALPAFSFSSDNDTGFANTESNNQMQIILGGVVYGTYTATNLEIGTNKIDNYDISAQFTEVATSTNTNYSAIQSTYSYLYGQVNSTYTALNQKIDSIAVSTGTNYAAIQSTYSALYSAIQSTYTALQTNLATEVSDRQFGDTTLGISTGTNYTAIQSTFNYAKTNITALQGLSTTYANKTDVATSTNTQAVQIIALQGLSTTYANKTDVASSTNTERNERIGSDISLGVSTGTNYAAIQSTYSAIISSMPATYLFKNEKAADSDKLDGEDWNNVSRISVSTLTIGIVYEMTPLSYVPVNASTGTVYMNSNYDVNICTAVTGIIRYWRKLQYEP